MRIKGVILLGDSMRCQRCTDADDLIRCSATVGNKDRERERAREQEHERERESKIERGIDWYRGEIEIEIKRSNNPTYL